MQVLLYTTHCSPKQMHCCFHTPPTTNTLQDCATLPVSVYFFSFMYGKRKKKAKTASLKYQQGYKTIKSQTSVASVKNIFLKPVVSRPVWFISYSCTKHSNSTKIITDHQQRRKSKTEKPLYRITKMRNLGVFKSKPDVV